MPTIYKASAKKKISHKAAPHVGVHHPVVSESVVQGTTMSPLTSFASHPMGVRFETQAAEEQVLLFLRQHFVVNVPWILIAIVMLLAPAFVFPFVLTFFPFQIPLPASYIVVGTIFWYLVTAGFILGNFIYWFFNIYIVTNQRVVDIDFRYLLFKEISEASLDKIQDLTYTSGGVVAALFDFGTVYIQTAAEVPNIEFERVPHPEQVIQTIRSLVGSLSVHKV